MNSTPPIATSSSVHKNFLTLSLERKETNFLHSAGNITFDAEIKPVSVNGVISAADIYCTATLPDTLELVNNSLDYGDTYTVNGTTYYSAARHLL